MFTPCAPHQPSLPAHRDAGTGAGLESYDPPSLNERDVSDKPAWLRRVRPFSTAIIEANRQGQFESLQAVDDAVQTIMRAMRRRPGSRRTMVIFTSDNGFMWGEHRLLGKFVPYLHASHVPLVIRSTRACIFAVIQVNGLAVFRTLGSRSSGSVNQVPSSSFMMNRSGTSMPWCSQKCRTLTFTSITWVAFVRVATHRHRSQPLQVSHASAWAVLSPDVCIVAS